MWYLISTLLLPVILAIALGLIVGWLTCTREPGRFWTGWVPLGTLAFAVALLVAVLKWIKGRNGLALDTGLLLFGAYIAGCCLGCILKQWLSRSSAPVLAAAAAPATAAIMPRDAVPQAVPSLPPEPPAAPKVEGEDLHSGTRPLGLVSPRGGQADDLKLIRGIGKQNEGRLHALGIWHFDQIAAWTRENVEWVGSYLAFPGRIDREDWLTQAKQLAAGVTTDFAARVKRGEVSTSRDDGSLGQANVAALGPDGYEGTRPQNTLSAARKGASDDLKLVNGIGRAIEQKLNAFGIWHFDQIEKMTDEELRFISHWLGFPGRALRENWREDCRTLAAGGETDHSRAVKAGKIPSSSNDGGNKL
ncbi:MAG: hypothetical protein ACRCTD_13260 [Beijerinckiaceae bacterium]